MTITYSGNTNWQTSHFEFSPNGLGSLDVHIVSGNNNNGAITLLYMKALIQADVHTFRHVDHDGAAGCISIWGQGWDCYDTQGFGPKETNVIHEGLSWNAWNSLFN